MSAHEQFADDLALLALGTLQGDERVALEKHLEGCSDCRRELERLRGDTALLALSAVWTGAAETFARTTVEGDREGASAGQRCRAPL